MAAASAIRSGRSALTATELPPAANPEASKEAGEVSQLDIENSLRFNNGLSLVTLTPEQLLEALENGVSNPGGIFAQVGGLKFSYDSTRPVGNRVESAVLVNEAGETIAVIVENGDVVAGAPSAIRMVTLTFLIGTPNASQPGRVQPSGRLQIRRIHQCQSVVRQPDRS